VSLIVAGTFRVPPENLAALAPHMAAVVAASRAEPGCLAYAYGCDLEDPGLIHVFEQWRDQASLDAHFAAPHMAAWREAREPLGFHDRTLRRYEVMGQAEI
jgi:quinol monooxygenase YgiN